MAARPFDDLPVAVLDRPGDVLAGAIPVVEDDLRLAIAVGIEQLPDMREAVPTASSIAASAAPGRRR